MEVAQNYKMDLQKPQVLYILGGPGSGKGTQCERLVRDFKFDHISVGDLMRAEIEGGTKEGDRIKSFVEKGAIVPTELTVGLLLKAVRSRQSKRFLIDGFPRGVEQALHLESAFREIDFIVNFDVPQEVLFERLTHRALTSGRKDDNPETIQNRISVFYESTSPVIEMYSKLGKVGNVSGLGEIEDIYQRVRQVILPNIIFFYGAPSTGKSEVAKRISAHTGYRYLHLQDFFNYNNCVSQTDKLNKLMKFFQETADRNFIVDDFLDQKAETVVFFEHFGKPRLLIYFQSTKDEIETNIRRYSKTEADKKTRLATLQTFLKNRDEQVAYFSKFNFYRVINAIDTLENITQGVLHLIRPKVFVAFAYNNPDLAENYLQRLGTDEGFIHINMEQILEDEVARKTSLGNQIQAFAGSGQTVPSKMQTDLLRKIFFAHPDNNRFVLTSFPEKKNEFEAFEKMLFRIDGLINFVKPNYDFSYSAKINPQLQYISQNKLIEVNKDDIGVFRSYLNKKTKYGIIMGPSASGKTTLARYISQRYGYTLIEWEPTIAILKEKLGQPGEPLEDVSLARIVDYYSKLFAPALTEKFIFDGFPPGSDQKAHIEQLLQIGQPSWIISNQISKEHLWKRFKLKNEMDAAAELTPEDDEKMTAFLNLAESQSAVLSDYASQVSNTNHFQLDVQNSLDITLKAIDFIYQNRIFIARSLIKNPSHDQLEALKVVYINIAARRAMTFVDVEKVILDHHSLIKNELEMRWTDLPPQFPSNYQPNSVVKLIQAYLQSLPSENKDILLWGYPSADHRLSQKPEETLFPRVSDEIIQLEKALGPIRIVNIITDQMLSSQIDDPAWELQKPEEKPKKAEGDDGGDPPADGGDNPDENKPKFNIYEHQWTQSDGHPKNIAQIYTQMKGPQEANLEVSEYSFKQIFDNFLEMLDKVNEDVSANFFVQVKINT